MGWGTEFKIDIYLNRQIFTSKLEVEEKIAELDKNIENSKSMLKMFAASTPNNIVSIDWKDDAIIWLNNEVNNIFESITEETIEKHNLQLYLEYLEENPIKIII